MSILLKNVFSLYLVHIVRLILPIALMPLLTARVSEDTFGLYVFTVALSAWLCLFVEYGFNISGTREIARAQNKQHLANIIAHIHCAKLLLVGLTFPVVLGAYIWVPVMHQNPLWLVCGWLAAIVIAFTPTFYYQGIEKTKTLAITEVVAGLFLFCSIYLFVQTEAESSLIIIFYFLARVIVCLFTQLPIFKAFSFSAYRSSVKQALCQLKSGVHCFVLQTLAALYTSFNVVLLGVWVGAFEIGIYGAAERLIRAGLGFIGQASNAVFPRITKLKTENPRLFSRYRIGALLAFFTIGILGVWVTHLLSPIVVPWLFNNKFNQAVEVVNILSWVIPAIALSNVLGFQFLLMENKEKVLNSFIAMGGILNLSLAFYWVPKHGYISMAWCWLATEWFITAGLASVVIYRTLKAQRLCLLVENIHK